MTNQELDKLMAEKVMEWGGCSDNWTPTESISDAFQVVEKMMEKGYDIHIDYYRQWIVDFGFPPKYEKGGQSNQKTIELAICLAAKKAIES